MTAPETPLAPGLYVTATPIGNLGDITYRAVETLKNADLILCEDTRQTAKLCAAYDIKTPRAPYHDHNGARVRPGVIKKLQDGAAICLVSDAGTPAIADPGCKLVAEARAAGVAVTCLPGANAAIAALAVTGAPSDRFLFAGFAPPKQGARARAFASLATAPATLIFYETAPRLAGALAAMAEAFGDRRAIVAREITKLHEEVRDGTLSALAAHYADAAPKGEIVVLVFPPEKQAPDAEGLDAFLADALATSTVKDAAAAAAEAFSIPRKEAYARALALKPQK
ncbi:MAG: 16S rRNA (cytidine(1402)-2'-O)-methyltransferase [Pseudomonadota bacterium]